VAWGRPARLRDGFAAQAGRFQRGAIRFQDDPVQGKETDKGKHTVEDRAEARMALPQRLFRLLALGDVLNDADEIVLVADYSSQRRNPPNAAIGQDNTVFILVDSPGLDRVVETALNLRDVVRVDVAVALIQARHRLFRFKPMHHSAGLVSSELAGVQVETPGSQVGCLEGEG
jgi:hypothetical protein